MAGGNLGLAPILRWRFVFRQFFHRIDGNFPIHRGLSIVGFQAHYIGSLHIRRKTGRFVLDKMIYARGEEVAHGDGNEEEAQNERFHFLWRLCVGKLQRGDGDEHLGGGQKHIGEQLPNDVGQMAGIDLHLNPRGNKKGRHCHEKADTHFAQGREWEYFVQTRINQPCEDRDEHHDHDRVDGVDLRRKPFDAQPVTVHAVGLEYPLGAGLVKERPEHRHKQVDDAQSANDLEAFFTEGFPQEIYAPSRDMHELTPSHPKHNGGQ